MKTIKALVLLLAATSFPAMADLYKCVNGSVTTYQQNECSAGVQKILVKQPKTTAAEDTSQRKVGVLRECLASKDCSPSLYVSLVTSLQLWENVRDVLGPPSNVQVIRGEEIHYYYVTSSSGKTMLQIHYTPGMVVKGVSAY